MLGAPQPKQLCFSLLVQHSLALSPFPAHMGIWVPPKLPLIPPEPSQGAASPLLHSQALCSLNFFLFLMQCQHPSGELTSFFFLDISKPSLNSRETPSRSFCLTPEQPAQPYLLQLTPGAGNAAQPPLPPPACPLCVSVPLCPAQVPHWATPKQECPSLCWRRSLCPLCLLDQGFPRPVPPSPHPELQAPTCKISPVHVTLPPGWVQKCGFNPL